MTEVTSADFLTTHRGVREQRGGLAKERAFTICFDIIEERRRREDLRQDRGVGAACKKCGIGQGPD